MLFLIDRKTAVDRLAPFSAPPSGKTAKMGERNEPHVWQNHLHTVNLCSNLGGRTGSPSVSRLHLCLFLFLPARVRVRVRETETQTERQSLRGRMSMKQRY